MNITTSITLNMQTPGYVVAYEPQGNKLSRFITATLKNGSASWSVPSGATAMIRVAKPDGTFAVYDKNEKGQPAYTISGSTVTIELVGAALAAAGDALVTVMFLDSTGSNLSPFSFRLIIMPSAVSDDDIVSSDYFNIFQETIDSIQQMLTETQAMYGSPLTAATASAMKNTSKIYVYVGAESGYSYGHWYYYNGSAWVDGGIYNSEGINSNWIYEAFFMGTIENTSTAHFTDGADNVPVKALRVAINPVQSGTGDPSPTNVRPITGWTGVNVNVAGKNLSFIDSGYSYDITTGSKSIAANKYATPKIKVDFTANQSYVIFDSDNNPYFVFAWDSNGNFVGRTGGAIRVGSFVFNKTSFTLGSGTKDADSIVYIAVGFYQGQNTDIATLDTAIFQIEPGTMSTAYEPYKGSTYPISFGSAGTVYGGTLDVTSGVLTVDSGFEIFDGSSDESWDNNTPTPGPTRYFVHKIGDIGYGLNSGELSNIYPVISIGGTENVGFDVYDSNGWGGFMVAVRPIAVSNMSVADFRALLAATPLQIYYKLAQPQTYQLTLTEVLTLLGENNIWADTGEIEELVYRADASLYLDSKISATKSIIAGIETNMVATKSYSIGDLLIVGDVLYKVASPIASGATFTPGTNVNATTVAEQLILLANS